MRVLSDTEMNHVGGGFFFLKAKLFGRFAHRHQRVCAPAPKPKHEPAPPPKHHPKGHKHHGHKKY